MEEIFIKIREDLYVSNKGRVMKIKGDGQQLTFLDPHDNGGGYKVVAGSNGKEYVHRLVAEAFLNNEGNLETVNHKDKNRSNNNAENLEWMSFLDNVRHGIAKAVVSIDKEGNRKTYPSVRAAEEDGFDASSICKVLKKKFFYHKGHRWEYA